MANNNDGQIILGLDIPKTVSQINADIKKLEKQLEQVKATGALDTSATVRQINSQIEALQSQLKNINIKATVDIKDSIKNTNQVQNQATQLGQQISKSVAQGVSQSKQTIQRAYDELTNFTKLNSSITNNGALTFNTGELVDYKNLLEGIKNTYAEFGQVKITNESFENGSLQKFKVNIEQVNGDLKETRSFWMKLNEEMTAFTFDGKITGSESIVQHLDKTKNAINQTAEAINNLKATQNADKIQVFADEGKYQAQYDTLIAKTNQWTNEQGEARIATTALKQSLDELNQASVAYANNSSVENAQKLSTALEKYDVEAKKVTNDIRTMNATMAKDSAIQKLNQQVTEFMAKNPKAVKAFGKELKNMILQTQVGAEKTNQELDELTASFTRLKNEARSTGKLGNTFFGTMKENVKSFVPWTTGTGLIMGLANSVKNMARAVYDIDTAQTNLLKVTNASNNELSKYWDDATDSAKKYGSAISDYISSTADWSRLGYNLQDSKQLADATTLLQKVGDNMTQESSSSGLISTLKGFQKDANEALDIVSKINEVANTQPIDTSGLFAGLERSASSMDAANNSLEQTIALITAANSVVQDPDSVGTAFKTMSMRIRGASTDLEAAGLDTEGMVTSTAKLREELLALSGVDIMIDDNTFKSTYDILDELSGKWSELTDIQQASITELVAGKRQGNIMSSLMSNFDIARDTLNTAMNEYEGSAERELENWNKSLEAHVARFNTAFQSLSQTVLDSDLLKGIVDIGTGAISFLDTITDKIGVLSTAGIGLGAALSFKNIGILKMQRIKSSLFCNTDNIGFLPDTVVWTM